MYLLPAVGTYPGGVMDYLAASFVAHATLTCFFAVLYTKQKVGGSG